jgi:hypothetical protein
MERLTAAGFEIAQSDPQRFRAHITAEIEKWGRVVREARISPD